MEKLEEILDMIEQEHPYHIPGNPETYSEYNDGWTDAIDRVRAELSKLDDADWMPVYEFSETN